MPLAAALKGATTQQGIVFGTKAAAVGVIVALGTKATAVIAPTLRADKAIGM